MSIEHLESLVYSLDSQVNSLSSKINQLTNSQAIFLEEQNIILQQINDHIELARFGDDRLSRYNELIRNIKDLLGLLVKHNLDQINRIGQ